MSTPPPGTCTRCGLAEATCHVVLNPELARILRVSETKFVDQGLCDRCWDELFGNDPNWEQFVQRREWLREMERARAMIERETWG
jgi:hypothetical protein